MRLSLSLPPVNESVTQKCIDETWSEYVLVIVWLMTWEMVNVFTFSQVLLDKSGSVVRGAQSRYRLSVEGAIHLWDNQNLCPNYDPQRRPHKNVRIYEIHFCGKAASAKKIFLSLFENATISVFLSTFYCCRRLCGPGSAVVFPGKEEIVFFSCPDLCLHKLVPHQFSHKSICVQTFVEFENSSYFLDFFHQPRPSRQPSQWLRDRISERQKYADFSDSSNRGTI